MKNGLKRLVYKHVLHRYPTWKKFQLERIATTNWDSFGDPETFLSRALKSSYINKETPEQIWGNLGRLCSDLKVPGAAEQIEAFRREHLSAQPTKVSATADPAEPAPYQHDEVYFNLVAPRVIAKKLYPILSPKSVVDVGCGLGTFLRAFKEVGAETVLGFDGDWVNRELLLKYISLAEFKAVDLQADFTSGARFDLVISLEVAEHLRPESADRFIKNLVSLGDVILFSAATPATWYDSSHLNNQWPDYWREKFASHGYFMHDVVRHIFLNDSDVCDWYRTNIFLVTKGKEAPLISRLLQISPENVELMKRSNLFYPMLSAPL